MGYLRQGETMFDALECALTGLVVEEGAAAVTVRRLASSARMSASNVLHHYESKARLLQVVALRAARRRRQAFERRYERDGLLALLPSGEEEVGDEVVWRALSEHGRTDDGLGAACEEWRAKERSYLDWVSGGAMSPTELDLLMGLVEGLCSMITRPTAPLAPERAAAALAAYLRLAGCRPSRSWRWSAGAVAPPEGRSAPA